MRSKGFPNLGLKSLNLLDDGLVWYRTVCHGMHVFTPHNEMKDKHCITLTPTLAQEHKHLNLLLS